MFCQMPGFSQNINKILHYGQRAPSSHNAQMWQVDTTYNSIRIRLDPTKLLNKVDPSNREAWISLGAFAENCILSASGFSLMCDIQHDSTGINLTFSKSTAAHKEKYAKWIIQRKTTRTPFKKEELSTEHQTIIKNFDVNITYYPLNSEYGKIIADNLYSSNIAQLNNSTKLQELSEWTITSRKEEKQRKDGLSPSDLGLNSFSKAFFYALFNKEKIQSHRFINIAQRNTLKQVNNCSGFIIITSARNNKEEWIKSGRLLQRLWLKLTELNIRVHPMSQSIEENYYPELKEKLNINNKEIQMIIRVGYSKPRKDCSARSDLKINNG